MTIPAIAPPLNPPDAVAALTVVTPTAVPVAEATTKGTVVVAVPTTMIIPEEVGRRGAEYEL